MNYKLFMELRLKGTTPKWNYSNHILKTLFFLLSNPFSNVMFVWCHSGGICDTQFPLHSIVNVETWRDFFIVRSDVIPWMSLNMPLFHTRTSILTIHTHKTLEMFHSWRTRWRRGWIVWRGSWMDFRFFISNYIHLHLESLHLLKTNFRCRTSIKHFIDWNFKSYADGGEHHHQRGLWERRKISWIDGCSTLDMFGEWIVACFVWVDDSLWWFILRVIKFK